MKLFWIVFGIFVPYIVVGIVLFNVADHCSRHVFDDEEVISVIIFYPFICLGMGILGLTKLLIRAWLSVKKLFDEVNDGDI